MAEFQSLDWVDVDFDDVVFEVELLNGGFNPSTGLMLISTIPTPRIAANSVVSIPRLG